MNFHKYSGNGNDFIILDNPLTVPYPDQLKQLCHRKFGIGADGVLVLINNHEIKEAGFDGKMRIFNSDGSEAEMCGNGLRCLVSYLDKKTNQGKNSYRILTMNGAYQAFRNQETFAVEMSEIKDKNIFDLSIFDDFLESFYINTGVPHIVFLSQEIDRIDLKSVCPRYRFHPIFPFGVNVNFVEILPGSQRAYVRTYERGVEDETYSCGTGLTACALALKEWLNWSGEVSLRTIGGDHLIHLKENKVLYSGDVFHVFSGNFSEGHDKFLEIDL